MIPPIKYLLNSFQSPLMRELHDSLDELEDVCSLIDRAIMDDPPLVIKDGGIIKEGYNEEIDRLRKAKTEGKTVAFRVGGQRAGKDRHQKPAD